MEKVGVKASLVNSLLPYAAWIVALVAMAGSLFFSEVMELPPCVLCWYQRIAMYPLVRNYRHRYFNRRLALEGLCIAADADRAWHFHLSQSFVLRNTCRRVFRRVFRGFPAHRGR